MCQQIIRTSNWSLFFRLIMENEELPDALMSIHLSLKPFIKRRKESASIRRILACNIVSDSHLIREQQVSRPLSLRDASEVNSVSQGTRGIQRDYTRALQNNSKARKAYAANLVNSSLEPEPPVNNIDLNVSRDEFLNLTRAQQKHERLCIVQDYVDMLGQKPPASRDYLDTKLALRDAELQPSIPSEIMGSTGVHGRLVQEELHDLVERLEKAVLRAKMLLTREQKLLSRIQSENPRDPIEHGSRTDALGTTRNELIIWIETELSRAGENSTEHEETAPISSHVVVGKGLLQAQIESSKLHYSQYLLSRQNLISASEEQIIATTMVAGRPLEILPNESSCRTQSFLPTIAPYLKELLSLSDDQKSMIQQKSHVSVALAKQLKDIRQGLDRLADESHLLPTHPLQKANSVQAGASSFGDEISHGEKPDLCQRAHAWVFAAASAGVVLKNGVSERLDEGGIALLEGQESLLGLLGFLGNDVEMTDSAREDSTDAWAVLNGKLGVI